MIEYCAANAVGLREVKAKLLIATGTGIFSGVRSRVIAGAAGCNYWMDSARRTSCSKRVLILRCQDFAASATKQRGGSRYLTCSSLAVEPQVTDCAGDSAAEA